jgi:hypothetical protein
MNVEDPYVYSMILVKWTRIDPGRATKIKEGNYEKTANAIIPRHDGVCE